MASATARQHSAAAIKSSCTYAQRVTGCQHYPATLRARVQLAFSAQPGSAVPETSLLLILLHLHLRRRARDYRRASVREFLGNPRRALLPNAAAARIVLPCARDARCRRVGPLGRTEMGNRRSRALVMPTTMRTRDA
jgi:hypothetical protein